ncbi:phosphoribosylamine--glycine ligase [Candidatus Parcubacteria bacterium]|nr:MAG: phosphoribosylamine--glycine ligase [Candidatus Parcubacteria bacterium]
MKKNVLVIGGGGREHALAWKLSQSPRVEKIYVAPGNGGIGRITENIPISATEIEKLAAFASKNAVDVTVVGPDDPLALGIVDAFRARGLRIFGPTKAAAEIEASKTFAKAFMKESGIPTARFEIFSDYEKAKVHLVQCDLPIVVKASGLALGKGVAVCKTTAEAERFLENTMVKKVFGDAGKEVVIEEYLEGQEISIHAFSDGEAYSLFPTAQDHKPIGDGDAGPNTGGMGTIAPVPWVAKESMEKIENSIVKSALKGLAERERTFTGCLYPGLKMTPQGPKVLEFNARFGDPETQSYMRLLKTDLLDVVEACIDGTLSGLKVEWDPGYAACIVLASGGYPGKYKKGKIITGVDEAEKVSGVVVFHAGTKEENGKLHTSGGRVLGVTAYAEDLKEALRRAYEGVSKIHFDGMQYRKDIGAKALG